jgi:hypothetical protein
MPRNQIFTSLSLGELHWSAVFVGFKAGRRELGDNPSLGYEKSCNLPVHPSSYAVRLHYYDVQVASTTSDVQVPHNSNRTEEKKLECHMQGQAVQIFESTDDPAYRHSSN